MTKAQVESFEAMQADYVNAHASYDGTFAELANQGSRIELLVEVTR